MNLISAINQNNSVLIKLNATRLDATIATDLKSEILTCVNSGAVNHVIIDLGSVTFMDSSGLGALVSVRKNIPRGHDIEIRNTTEFVSKVMKLTKMDRVFSIN